MTEAEQKAEEEALIRWQEEHPDVWFDQDENGVDLTHLRENLKLTPAERISRHGRATIFASELKEAGERYRAAQRGCSGLP